MSRKRHQTSTAVPCPEIKAFIVLIVSQEISAAFGLSDTIARKILALCLASETHHLQRYNKDNERVLTPRWNLGIILRLISVCLGWTTSECLLCHQDQRPVSLIELARDHSLDLQHRRRRVFVANASLTAARSGNVFNVMTLSAIYVGRNRGRIRFVFLLSASIMWLRLLSVSLAGHLRWWNTLTRD